VVLRDRGYRWLIGSNFGYAMTGMALNVAMPVYVVDMLGLPGWVSGGVFVINTVMIGVGQGLVVRGMTGAVRRWVLHVAVAFSATSFVMFYAAGALSVVTAVALVLVAAFVYTLGEMTAGPVVAALSAEAAPADQRGRYMASTQLAWSISSAVAPLLYSALLHRGSLALWAGAVLLCAVWALLVEVLAVRMPLAGWAVTNVAEPVHPPVRPAVPVDPAAEAPTIL
jgi:MFS family permease